MTSWNERERDFIGEGGTHILWNDLDAVTTHHCSSWPLVDQVGSKEALRRVITSGELGRIANTTKGEEWFSTLVLFTCFGVDCRHNAAGASLDAVELHFTNLDVRPAVFFKRLRAALDDDVGAEVTHRDLIRAVLLHIRERFFRGKLKGSAGEFEEMECVRKAAWVAREREYGNRQITYQERESISVCSCYTRVAFIHIKLFAQLAMGLSIRKDGSEEAVGEILKREKISEELERKGIGEEQYVVKRNNEEGYTTYHSTPRYSWSHVETDSSSMMAELIACFHTSTSCSVRECSEVVERKSGSVSEFLWRRQKNITMWTRRSAIKPLRAYLPRKSWPLSSRSSIVGTRRRGMPGASK